ncbi:MAG: glycoside hydrolase family 5 protein, partial [Chloroflexi bacterium]
MPRSYAFRLMGLLLLIAMCAGIFWIRPLTTLLTRSARSAQAASPSSLTYHQYADGPYRVQGNQIIGADGKPYIFHGIGLDGLEFACQGDGNLDSGHLAFMGSGTSNANGTYWFANTVRLPLTQSIWLNGLPGQCTAAQYQATVKQTVDTLTALKLNVIIDLQWTDAGGQAQAAGWEMPDARSVTFWQQVAPIYASYTNVLFELYNEPHPTFSTSTATWQCWLSGCQITNDNGTVPGQSPSYQAVGMQTLVTTVRTAGANNVVLVAGTNWGYELSGITTNKISGSNVVYDTHPYPYGGKNTPALWDASFGNLTSTYPIISAESGEYDCLTKLMSQLVPYFDAHSMGWVAWAWYDVGGSNSGCGYPQLISNYQGTPLASMGRYIYQQFLSYANQGPPPSPTPSPSPSPSPTPSPKVQPGPVFKTWYFAEGRAGDGFTEWLSLDNPTSNTCRVNITYLYTPDRGSPLTKNVPVTVYANQRLSEFVDNDLSTSPSGIGISDSAILTVDTNATPNCTGIVAERPMYFAAVNTTSGSDVLGVTKLARSFYFADLASGTQPSGGSYASFLPILNPPGGQTAHLSATYYWGGHQVGQQSLAVLPGTRGTIFPSQASPALPAHVAVLVSSDQLVAVERPTYFNHLTAGNAGIVSGAADVIGVQALSSDWLFAEGYTGGQFQENFVIANLDTSANTTANVTIKLEYPDGSTSQSTLHIPTLSQTVFNVNSNASEPGQSVSAEITSTGASIVAEREMFFAYNHQSRSDGRNLWGIGG